MFFDVVYELSDTTWDGRVLSQDPWVGAEVASASVVTLWIGDTTPRRSTRPTLELIVALWEGYTNAWFEGGYLAASEYQINFNYPYPGLYEHTPESCSAASWPEGPPDYIEVYADPNGITRDDGWVGSGPYAGVEIEGRIYEVWLFWRDSFSTDFVDIPSHAVVGPSGARAAFFFPCA